LFEKKFRKLSKTMMYRRRERLVAAVSLKSFVKALSALVVRFAVTVLVKRRRRAGERKES